MAQSAKNQDGRLNNDLKRGTALFIPTPQGGISTGPTTAFGTVSFNDSSNIIKLSASQISLKAGIKYHLSGSIRADLNTNNYITYCWYNVTTSTYVGNYVVSISATWTASHATASSDAHLVIVPPVDTIMELRLTDMNGSTVSTWITAYALIEEVEAYIPVLSSTTAKITQNADGVITYPLVELGAGIVESGYNNNGSWIKFSDGTMVQWCRASQTTGNNSGTVNLFPTSFIDRNYQISAIQKGVSSGGTTAQYTTETQDISMSSFSVKCLYYFNGAWNDSTAITFFIIAIGRWK